VGRSRRGTRGRGQRVAARGRSLCLHGPRLEPRPLSPADTKGGKIGYFPTFKMLPHPVPFDMHRRMSKHVGLLGLVVYWGCSLETWGCSLPSTCTAAPCS